MGRRKREQVGEAGRWTFFEVTGHSFGGDLAGKPLYEFEVDGVLRPGAEMYLSLDHALVAAVGEKHTAPRGAGGPGVGTAADWFMVMIGAEPRRVTRVEVDRMALVCPACTHRAGEHDVNGCAAVVGEHTVCRCEQTSAGLLDYLDQRRSVVVASLRDVGIEVEQ